MHGGGAQVEMSPVNSPFIMKRASDFSERTPKSGKTSNEYQGYVVNEDDRIHVVKDRQVFRRDYLEARKPVKLAAKVPVDLQKFRLESITETLQYSDLLQVERKVNFGFGSGKTRERLTLQEVVQKLQSGDDSYYLTTQYEEDEEAKSRGIPDNGINTSGEEAEEEFSDAEEQEVIGSIMSAITPGRSLPSTSEEEEEEEDLDFSNLRDDFEDLDESDMETENQTELQFRVKTLLQPPLTNLALDESFPLIPGFFKNLIPQQINLWMGSSSNIITTPDLLNPTIETLGKYVPHGNSSGLHHDHADNLYVLIQGKKRFTLYSPDDAEKLSTVGDIRKIYANGLIDYQVNENAPFWRPMREDGAIVAEWANWAIESKDPAPHTREDLVKLIEEEPRFTVTHGSSLDPPSFSRIPPVLAHLDEIQKEEEKRNLVDFSEKHFPGFLDLRKIEVWLEPGEMLYIPTGWFHEVTSYSTNDDSAHVALNWWFMPPSGHISQPYMDNYWSDDFELTLEAVALTRERGQNATPA